MPVVVSVTSEINKPRRAPLAQILRASRKPLNTWALKDLGIDPSRVGSGASTISVLSNLAPEQERKNVIMEGDLDETVGKLVDALRKEGVLQ
jgi:electron transfer flavoprotein beta subunit